MKAAVYFTNGHSQAAHFMAAVAGFARHGIEVEFFDRDVPSGSDFAVVWGWRTGRRIQSLFKGPILVLEHGFIDRSIYSAMGWDGLNGRGRHVIDDDPTRMHRLFGHRLHDWYVNAEGEALIVGQCKGDAALANVDVHEWYRDAAQRLHESGWPVAFRQHPVETRRGVDLPALPDFVRISSGSLDEAFALSGLVVTYNSNTGVDALLAGLPLHTQDEGSMVFDISSHDFEVTRSPREKRMAELANIQWTLPEIASGDPWERVKTRMFE